MADNNKIPIVVAVIGLMGVVGVPIINHCLNPQMVSPISQKNSSTSNIIELKKPLEQPTEVDVHSKISQSENPLTSQSITVETITIGNQIWSTRNIDVNKYQNGDDIPQARNIEELLAYNQRSIGCWSYLEFDPENGKKYGKLYNWHAVNDPRQLATSGWHVPSEKDFAQLIAFFVEGHSGKSLKSSHGWYSNGNGMDKVGWSGLPGGLFYADGTTPAKGACGIWWTSTAEVNLNNRAVSLELDSSQDDAHMYNFNQNNLCSVRLIKD